MVGPAFVALTLLWLSSTTVCAQKAAAYGSSLDSTSYSNVEEFVPQHLSFALGIDFESSSVTGTVTHTFRSLTNGSSILYMDVRGGLSITGEPLFWTDDILDVDGCRALSVGRTAASSVPYEISEPNPNHGKALAVTLPCAVPAGTQFYLAFDYATNPDNEAFNWLTPEQTAGKELPYMYSMCQMNYCRDFAPMMDTPSQKVTYDATIVAPNQFVVLMSANATSTLPHNDTHTITSFNNTIKIPSYLIAIVVGDLETRNLDDRVSIISEPSIVDAAAEEFSQLPEILAIVEDYLTPYIWGTYSIVFMPPSFAWGGMEHPLMTLASPTLITGDKSKVSTAIHEVTHSWFGNDVSCLNWDNFWLNEGMNTFMERKTLALLLGEERAKIEYFTVNISMYNEMLDYGLDHSYSSLFPNIQEDDPENTISLVPYDKGSQFLYYIETLIGEDLMQQMLRQYLVNFSQQAITHRDFEAFYESFLYSNFDNRTAAELIVQTDWDTWVLEPGLAPVPLNFSTDAISQATQLAEEYLTLKGEDSPEEYAIYHDFIAWQQLAFVQTLANSEDTTVDILSRIDSDLNITSSTDPDVKTDWYILGIQRGYQIVMEPCHKWMGEQGRNAHVKPTFLALVESDMCDIGRLWHDEYRSFYTIYISNVVSRILEDCPPLNESGTVNDLVVGAPDGDQITPPADSGTFIDVGADSTTHNRTYAPAANPTMTSSSAISQFGIFSVALGTAVAVFMAVLQNY